MLKRENVHIIGDKGKFVDRHSAGERLVPHVLDYISKNDLEDVVVLGLPRGGMVVAAPIAQALGARPDFVITRKLLAPNQPNLAIGAVTERGRAFLNTPVIDALGIKEAYIEAEIEAERREIDSSMAVYRAIVPPLDLAGKTIVLVDDNVLTGSTMFATLRGLWAERPNHIVIALPIAPRDTLMALGDFADAIITLQAPATSFSSMEPFYDNFEETTTEQVTEILEKFVTVLK